MVLSLQELPPKVRGLLHEYRIMVNEAIRYSLQHKARSRKTMQPAYERLRTNHPRTSSFYAANARDEALACLKNYRRWLKKTKKQAPTMGTSRHWRERAWRQRLKTPYRKRLAVRIDANKLHIDAHTGLVAFPLRAGESAALPVRFGAWHRAFLEDSAWRLGAAVLTPDRLILTLRKEVRTPYEPTSFLALDTNETSLDGVEAKLDGGATLVQAPFPDVRIVQSTHVRRRSRLAKKKPNDARIRRELLQRDGRREKNRVKQRLHMVSKNLIEYARKHKSAIVLEDLHTPGGHTKSRRMNRRLSSWPRGELHRQIEYKAQAAGVPIIKVDPKNTSQSCPACGAITRRRGRAGRAEFRCSKCPWRLDRQYNAGLNILKTATAKGLVAVRADWFQPASLRTDAVTTLYHPRAKPLEARPEPTRRKSRFLGAQT